MSLKVSAISSGSSGNCYIIENSYGEEKKYFLVDCGVSYSLIKDFCVSNLIDMNLISHVFITHEHSDHIKSLNSLLKENSHITLVISKEIEYYIFKNAKTVENSIIYTLINSTLLIGDIEVYPFEISHDCINPLNFIFKHTRTQKRIGFFTDLGEFTMYHVQLAKLCSLVVVESNYDEELALSSKMHQNYISRLFSSKGHLSNFQTQEFISQFARENQTILLAHISENVNTYERVFNSIYGIISKLSLINISFQVCFQNCFSEWIEL